MPGQLKEDVVRPKLKKKSLDFEEYWNFRPINLKVVSKIIERAFAVQVKNYITDNDLDESLQSAYKHLQSTQTALLKVQKYILCTCAIDDNKCVALFCWTCPVHLTSLITDLSWIDCAVALV